MIFGFWATGGGSFACPPTEDGEPRKDISLIMEAYVLVPEGHFG